jgi:hypothetical protein
MTAEVAYAPFPKLSGERSSPCREGHRQIFRLFAHEASDADLTDGVRVSGGAAVPSMLGRFRPADARNRPVLLRNPPNRADMYARKVEKSWKTEKTVSNWDILTLYCQFAAKRYTCLV